MNGNHGPSPCPTPANAVAPSKQQGPCRGRSNPGLLNPCAGVQPMRATISFFFSTAALRSPQSRGLADVKGQAVEWESSSHIAHLIATYGFLAIGVIIALESMGLPLPGESITAVVASAAVGAVLGDNVGYWIGREFGYQLLRRYGSRIGLTPNKIKLGQYLFLRH